MPAKTAVTISAGQMTKHVANTQLAYNVSCILDEHWSKVAAKCKGEKALLKALKVEDKRTAPAGMPRLPDRQRRKG